MTKKKSHLRRTPLRNHPAAAPRTSAADEDDLVEEIATKHGATPLLPGTRSLVENTALDDRVKIRPSPGDPTKDYTMPRGEAMKLLKQGKLKVSNAGGFEATDTYPGNDTASG